MCFVPRDLQRGLGFYRGTQVGVMVLAAALKGWLSPPLFFLFCFFGFFLGGNEHVYLASDPVPTEEPRRDVLILKG